MRFIDHFKPVVGCAPAALATTAGDGDYVSLENFNHITFVITVDNGATVTGGVVTLKQATAVAGTGEKELAFATMFANTDVGAGDTLTETTVTSNTFTTSTTDNKNLMYVIEVDAEDLDVDGGFDCVRIDVASMANAVGSVVYILSEPRYNALSTSAIID